jgi:hypothetical protein
MATIRVKCGCGITYRDAAGTERHALKTPEDGSFECDDAQAARLVKMGVANYVDNLGWQAVEDPDPLPDGSQEPKKKTGTLDKEQLESMDYNKLKKLAAEMGVKPKGSKKADLVEAISAAEVEVEDSDDYLPDLSTAEPE